MKLRYILAATAVWSLWNASQALAVECPPNTPKCKVLFITPEEEQALTGPNGILDIAERGAMIQLGGAVKYFRDKLAKAPAGESHKQSEPPADASPKGK